MEHIPGIRLYDLLRLLGRVANDQPELRVASQGAATKLVQRSFERLALIQQALLEWSASEKLAPYPFATHITSLLDCLLLLTDLPALTNKGRCELQAMSAIWTEEDATIPFRDATPKNILVGVPDLAPDNFGDSPSRLDAVARWVGTDQAAQVRIVDYDFSSVQHLTAPEDDGISLLAHRGSIAIGREILSGHSNWTAALAQLPEKLGLPFKVNHSRTARALLVRYLRFGGRKLMYRLLNPDAYSVRFLHDCPQHYFQVLAQDLTILDPSFQHEYPELHDRLIRLAAAVRRFGLWTAAEAGHDPYLARFGDGLTFWQESPVVGMHRFEG